MKSLHARCIDAIDQVRRLGFNSYGGFLAEISSGLARWQTTLHDDGLDVLVDIVGEADWPNLPNVPNATPNKDLAKSIVESIRNAVKAGPGATPSASPRGSGTKASRQFCRTPRCSSRLVEQFESLYRSGKDASRSVDFADLERLALRSCATRREGPAPSDVARGCHRALRSRPGRRVPGHQRGAGRDPRTGEPRVHRRRAGPSNLFCVGDVKQSIYRFRLAEPRRFLERQHQFRSDAAGRLGEVIDLQANFRSRGPLLRRDQRRIRAVDDRKPPSTSNTTSRTTCVPEAAFPNAGEAPGFPGAPDRAAHASGQR